ncbi:MAG: ATP-binding protein [Alphaproteobacteria bacterium]
MNKITNILCFLPGLIILAVGMIALHSSVSMSSEQAALERYYRVISAQNLSLSGNKNTAVEHNIQNIYRKIQMREDWLYWSVIALGLTAFLLLVLNANKLRKLESMNAEKQESLKLLKQRLAAIEASFEGICIVDGDGTLSYMNPALMALHAIPPERRSDYIGKSWLELYNERNREDIHQRILPEFEEKGFWRGKAKLFHDDESSGNQAANKTTHIELLMTRLDSGGFVGAVRDITEQEKADAEKQEMQDQLFQAQKMEAIGRLAGGIAHDFNNILAAMNGNAEFLAEDLEEGSPTHKFALNILQAGRQARSLVDRILTFSRRRGGETEYIDLCTPLHESISMLEATLPKTIELETEINVSKAPVLANATQISQMIMNLCVNARDAMEKDKGKISISLSQPNLIKELPLKLLRDELPGPEEAIPIHIESGPAAGQSLLYLGRIAKKHDYIRLSVSDTGSGIKRAILEKIFEPFFTTKDAHKGTGLGLSSVHGIITAHRGALIIDTTIGQGTRFDVFFPASEAKNIEHDEEEESHPENTGGKILLVEDQQEVLQTTKTMLRRLGYDVETAISGLEALDILREHPDKFDVVVTDQNMPKMTGLELIDEAYPDFKTLPFLLLSGYSEEKLQGMMEEHPAIRAIMRKPVSQKDLGKKLARILKDAPGPASRKTMSG